MSEEQGKYLACFILGAATVVLIWVVGLSITQSAAITACEFNTERVIKCEYIRTAMPITPEQRNK